ncbi:glutamine synthetase beta-grasp domain-containing protein [Bacteroidota bacterium]
MAEKKEKFALESPISRIAGKDRIDLTRDDIINIITKKKLERITFHYTGIDGKIKELKIPITNRKYAELVLTEGERVDGSSLFKGIIDTGKSDLYVVPQYNTAFLNPFDKGSIDFICRFINPEGEHAEFPPDSILYNASKMLKKNTGMELWGMGELEFYLLSDPENNSYPLQKQTGYHASSPYVKNNEVLNEMLRLIAQVGGQVKYAHNEVGCITNLESEQEELNGKTAEQVEIEFLPMPIEDMGDMLVLSRWIIRNVAYRYFSIATFVPKIETDYAGSGMHVHMALMKNGKNQMVDAKGELSKNAKKLIGGLCRYASSLNAFGNTVSSSYLRLVPGQEAPTKVCWSAMNRSALIRVPLGWNNVDNLAKKVNLQQKSELKFDSRQTVELRSPDGSCNSHLLLAGITMAAEWGLYNEKESLKIAGQSQVTGDIHGSENVKELPELAASCVESAEKLLENRAIFERKGIFPAKVIDYIAKQLQNEDDKNMNKRLMALPDEEKLRQSRSIMHRDIHKN